MFICRDVTEQYFVSVYWEQKELFVVVKEVSETGDITQRSAVCYGASEAQDLMEAMVRGVQELQSVRFTATTTLAIIGRIAEGLQSSHTKATPSRISPGMWG